MKKKGLALILALVLVTVSLVSGTMAWLTAQTDPLTNTFMDSDINITLTESTSDYKMIPGHTITKDPMVTVDANSEPCYLFVQVTEDLGAWADNDPDMSFGDYLSYSVAGAWTALDGVADVYYMVVEDPAEAPEKGYPVLTGNAVLVSGENVTKEMMDEVDGDDEEKPTLTFKAYAVQLYTGAINEGKKVAFTPAEAWSKASALNNPGT